MQPFLTQVFDLILIQLTNWRWSWRGSIIIGMLAPLLSIAAFGAFTAGSGAVTTSYVLTGNIVLTLLMEGLTKVSNHFAFMRMNGSLDYFATLPIYRSALVVATVLAFLLLSLPATLATLIIGAGILNISLQIQPALVLVIPLISLSLCGLGAIIGLLDRAPDEINSISLLATLFLFGFGPVLIPLEKLPPFMTTLSLLSPSTYAASALRQTVLNQPDRLPLWLDMLVLSAVALLFLWIVNSRMDWRARQ
jgi:ABC-2 type transport system permease protein